jgi:membrane protein implicated in regulation of membrane protease activity
MNWPDIFLFCFAVGALWSFASLLLGGMHLGHSGHGHFHLHGHGHGIHTHGNGIHAHGHGQAHAGHQDVAPSWIGSMVNPSCAAVYLAWFGGVGYLLTRHSGLAFWLDLLIAIAVGLTGAWFLAGFLRFLQSRERPLDPADYDMVGVLGHVSSTIRPDGVGEMIFVRDGARVPVAARTENGQEIPRGEEVVITRYEKGIAFVRTWEAMTQTEQANGFESSQKETNNVE